MFTFCLCHRTTKWKNTRLFLLSYAFCPPHSREKGVEGKDPNKTTAKNLDPLPMYFFHGYSYICLILYFVKLSRKLF